MLFKSLSIVLILVLQREGGISAFSTTKPGVAGANHHLHTTAVTAKSLPTQEDAVTFNLDRRGMLKGLGFFSASALVTMAMGSTPVWADVSDGTSLPQGAAQFQRVVRAKSDLLGVIKRVTEGASDMDKAEWNNVGQFLRRVYAVSEDMKAIASGFDSIKKQRASELIDGLKKNSKAADAPTGTANGPEFVAYAKKLIAILDEFLDLLSDVPDEI